jgi:phosphoribosylglycinamide formyltransferase-1
MSFDHRQFATREAFEQVVDGYCRDRQVEIIACAGFMRVMTEGFAARWLGRMINIHPSLLPSYRGLDTHARALTEGVRIHGCTVHFVTGDLDAGPIIAQAAVPVFEHDTVHTLAQRVLVQEHVLYPLVLDWVASGAVTLQSNKVSYAFPPPDEFEPLFSPSASR